MINGKKIRKLNKFSMNFPLSFLKNTLQNSSRKSNNKKTPVKYYKNINYKVEPSCCRGFLFEKLLKLLGWGFEMDFERLNFVFFKNARSF